MARVASVTRGEAEINVVFTESELERWKSYAVKYAQLAGGDWFLANQIDGIIADTEKQ